MKAVIASIELDEHPDSAYRLPASRNVSFIYTFPGQREKLGALAVSPRGIDFAPGTKHAEVHLDFWADDEWTDVVQPGTSFTIWYGRDVGRGVVLGVREPHL